MNPNANPLADALALLPHGPEFRFLDRLTSLEPGKRGTGEYVVKGSEPYLRGHFPGDPIFPGVLIVEAAAQLAGVVAQSDPALEPLLGLKLTAIWNLKILGAVRPGECVRIDVQITARFERLVQARAIAWVGEKRIMSGEVVLSGDPSVPATASTGAGKPPRSSN